jgi:hypothetical protein
LIRGPASRNHRGQIEIALIEWKYRENYTSPTLSGGAAKNATREQRYRHLVEDPDGPIRSGILRFDAFLTEPLYQLMRQQLLAWRLEQAKELDADIVRVVYCAPSANRALWDRLLRPAWERELARGLTAAPGPLLSLWTRLLRRPDRFVYFDTARLLEPQMPTSTEWRSRYGHLAVGTQRVQVHDADLIAVIDSARIILERVAGGGGVLEQLAELVGEHPGQLPPAMTQSLASRIADIAEQTRQLRADDVFEALEAFRSDGKRDEVEPERRVPRAGSCLELPTGRQLEGRCDCRARGGCRSRSGVLRIAPAGRALGGVVRVAREQTSEGAGCIRVQRLDGAAFAGSRT